jgi:hypothetical protein
MVLLLAKATDDPQEWSLRPTSSEKEPQGADDLLSDDQSNVDA